MNNKKNTPSRTVISAMISTVISLAVLLSALLASQSLSLAWMAQCDTVNAADMTISVPSKDITAEYKLYISDFHGVGTDTDENGDPLTLDGVTLNTFDAIFTDRNEITPLCIKITLTGNDIPQSGNIEITISRTPHGDESLQNLTEYCSSVLNFDAGTDKSLGSLSDPNELYHAIKTAFIEGNISKDSDCFTTLSDGTFYKTERITLLVPYDENELYEISGEKALDVYLFVTYNKTLTTIMSKVDEFKGELVSGLVFLMDNDLKDITIDFPE